MKEEEKKNKRTPKKNTTTSTKTNKKKTNKQTKNAKSVVTKKEQKKKNLKQVEIIEKTNQYSEYEDFHIEKQLSKVFKFLMFISVILSIVVILKNKDVCIDISYAKCGPAYNIANNNFFFIFLWIENILAIVFCLYKIFCAIVDKTNKNVIMGIIGILIQPIVWENILKALNILW